MTSSRAAKAVVLICWLLENCFVKASSSNSTNPMQASSAKLAAVKILKRPDALHISTFSRQLKGNPGNKKNSKTTLKIHDGPSNSSPATVPPREALPPPAQKPSLSGFNKSDTAIFYVVADSPYSTADASRLLYQMQHIPVDADFVVHLGDIRDAAGHPICRLIQYRSVSDILRNSWAPVFITLGDNDWNDCPNPSQGLSYWKREFLYFYEKYWNIGFNVNNMPGRPENLSFVLKNTLFFVVDMPGSVPLNEADWAQQLTDEVEWSWSCFAVINMK